MIARGRRPDEEQDTVPLSRRQAWSALTKLVLLAGACGTLATAAGLASRGDIAGLATQPTVLSAMVFVLACALLTAALVPPAITAAAAGALFGTAAGTGVALVAVTGGVVLAALLARCVAPGALHALAGPRMLKAITLIEKRSFLSLLYARLTPGVPQALISYATGLVRLPLRHVAAASALALAPRLFAYAAIGEAFGDFRRPETIVAVTLLVATAIGGSLGTAIARRRRRRAVAAPAA